MGFLEDILKGKAQPYLSGAPTASPTTPNTYANVPSERENWQASLRAAMDMAQAARKPSIWSQVPAGKTTVARDTLSENVRAQKVNEMLQAQQLAETIRHNKVAEGLSARGGTSGPSGTSGLTALQIANFRAKAWETINNDPNYMDASDAEKQQASDQLFYYYMGVTPPSTGEETYEVSDDAVNKGGTGVGVGFNPATDGIKGFKMPRWWNSTPTPAPADGGLYDIQYDPTPAQVKSFFTTKKPTEGTTSGWEYL